MTSKSDKIYIAGHNGMVGSACLRLLKLRGYNNITVKSSQELDLRNQSAVNDFIKNEKPVSIIDAAARVGGILANDSYPYEFLIDNMLIQNNLIRSAHENNVGKFIFLGSSCIYPKFSKQPIKEEYLLTSSLEPTNEWYAIAKISGVKLIESIRKQFNRDYVSLMPTNLYGPKDNFDLNRSHVIPAIIRKLHEAKLNDMPSIKLWGTGNPKREFLYVDDLAETIVFVLENNLSDHIYNVGSGVDYTIKEISEKINSIVKYKGNIEWDTSKPDGTPRKLMDSSKINNIFNMKKTTLHDGLIKTYKWYLNNK